MNLSRIYLITAFIALFAASGFTAIAVPDGDVITKTDDTRLDQKVTCNAEGMRIADVLSQLSQSTGVTMAAGLDQNDWMVYDRKVVLHVKDMKLRELMQEVASILRFQWERKGENGKCTYNLLQNKDQALEEQRLRDSAEDSATKEARAKRENAIADIVNLGSLSESDAAGLKNIDPWRYILATEPLGKGVAEFINGCPEARNALVRGQSASFPVSALSPQLQETVRKIAQSYDSLLKSINATEDHSDLLARLDKLQISINSSSSGGADVLSQNMLGRITISSGFDSFLEIPLFDPSSAIGKAMGKAIVSLKSGVSRDTVATQLESDLKAAAAVAQAPKPSGRDISSDKALTAKIKIFNEATIAPLSMTLKSLAENSGLNVISDCFPGTPPRMSADDKTLGEQLELIGSSYGSIWEKSGNTLRFRDREWFKKRAWEVPQVWFDYWLARAAQNECLLLEDFMQIAGLRDEQIDHTILTNPKLMRLGAGDVAQNRFILRFYSKLSDDQRKALLMQKLDVSAISEDQWTLLQQALSAKGAACASAPRGSQFLRMTQAGSDSREYKFSYYPSDNEPAVIFKIGGGEVYKTADEVAIPNKK